VEEELTEGLKGLHLREETESEEETKSDKTKMNANQETGQAAGSQVLVPTNGQGAESLVPDPRFFDGE
jgi:hypothetical protein